MTTETITTASGATIRKRRFRPVGFWANIKDIFVPDIIIRIIKDIKELVGLGRDAITRTRLEAQNEFAKDKNESLAELYDKVRELKSKNSELSELDKSQINTLMKSISIISEIEL